MGAACGLDQKVHKDNLETFELVWLDTEVHTSEENRAAQQKIRATINHVITYQDMNQCEQYIHSVNPYDRLVLIVSGKLGQEVVPRIHQMRQLSSVYVYCTNKEKHEKWAKNFVKVEYAFSIFFLPNFFVSGKSSDDKT